MQSDSARSKKLVIAAWKTYLTLTESKNLAKEIRDWVAKNPTICEIVLAPSFPHIVPVRHTIGTAVGISAQNVDLAGRGAYTGHTPPQMLSDAGCNYVLLGHSELRKYKKETDQLLKKKAEVVLAESDMGVVLCIGESYRQKTGGRTLDTLESQLRTGLGGIPGVDVDGRLDIAYEPVWAISSENPQSPPEPQDVDAIHGRIKSVLVQLFGEQIAKKIRVLYGGSVNPSNVGSYVRQPNIDGVLVGSASTKFPGVIDLLKAVEDSIRSGSP